VIDDGNVWTPVTPRIPPGSRSAQTRQSWRHRSRSRARPAARRGPGPSRRERGSRDRQTPFRGIAFFNRPGHRFADGATVGAVAVSIQAILLPGVLMMRWRMLVRA
jgi:hypothetical protein